MRNTSDLRDRAESIMRLMEQRNELNLDIKAAFEAAASAGYNAKAMKKAIKVASMDADKRAKHEQEQGDLLLYLQELEQRNEGVRCAA
jgi:uncharacterized protein (UPF0335 family)